MQKCQIFIPSTIIRVNLAFGASVGSTLQLMSLLRLLNNVVDELQCIQKNDVLTLILLLHLLNVLFVLVMLVVYLVQSLVVILCQRSLRRDLVQEWKVVLFLQWLDVARIVSVLQLFNNLIQRLCRVQTLWSVTCSVYRRDSFIFCYELCKTLLHSYIVTLRLFCTAVEVVLRFSLNRACTGNVSVHLIVPWLWGSFKKTHLSGGRPIRQANITASTNSARFSIQNDWILNFLSILRGNSRCWHSHQIWLWFI